VFGPETPIGHAPRISSTGRCAVASARPYEVGRRGIVHERRNPAVAPDGDGWRAVVALRDRVAADIAAHCPELHYVVRRVG